jgi:hypothetical protein
MLGFGKKKAAAQKPTQTEDGSPSAAGPLKLRDPGGMLVNPQDTPAPKANPEEKAPLRAPKKTKLHLMTGREEKERAFQAAREHYLSKNLPSIRKETRIKERGHLMEFIMDRLIAVVGFFLVVCGWLWLYHHGAEVEAWWKAFLDGISIL